MPSDWLRDVGKAVTNGDLVNVAFEVKIVKRVRLCQYIAVAVVSVSTQRSVYIVNVVLQVQ